MSSGKLQLTVCEAKLTRDTETFGKMDPYCVIALRGQKFKTKVMDGAGKTPKWNQVFDINVEDARDDLAIVIWDEDVMSDDKVGECKIGIQEIIANAQGPAGAWLDIFHKSKQAGSVLFKANWVPAGAKAQAVSHSQPQAHSAPKANVSGGGILHLVVTEAKLTRDTEMFGKMDPYAKITVNGTTYKTKVLDGAGKNPKWNQAFDIAFSSPNDAVTFAVMDEDVTSDDKVGEVKTTIGQLLASRSLAILHKNKSSGEVFFEGSMGAPVHSAPKTAHASHAGANRQGSALNITVVEAKLTRDTETFGKMDPYVVITNDGQKYKTKVLDGAGKTPKWNQQLSIAVHGPGDTITLAVMDEDVTSDDKVGEVTLTADDLARGGWITILHKNKSSGQVLIQGTLDGQQAPPKTAVHASAMLHITCIEAKLTRDTETFGKMDPYCVITVNGKKNKTKVLDGAGKTPKWNQAFDIPVEGLNQILDIAVFDEDTMSDDKVGDVKLSLAELISSDGWVTIYHKNKPSGQVHFDTHGFGGAPKVKAPKPVEHVEFQAPKAEKPVKQAFAQSVHYEQPKPQPVVRYEAPKPIVYEQPKPVKKEKKVAEVHAKVDDNKSYTYQNGATYSGDWAGIRRHGQGTFREPSGNSYTGEFQNDLRHGNGQLNYADGSTYSGQWHQDARIGKGHFKWHDGNEYNGEFHNDQMNGNGTFTWRTGASYSGAWKNNKRHGRGTMHFRDGSVYVGDWKEDRRDGEGVMTWKSGAKYEGTWSGDVKHGHGRYTWDNNDQYEGEWVKGRRTGAGALNYQNGDRYQGGFRNNMRHGSGEYTGHDGTRYNGEWQFDEKDGNGSYTWRDRTSYNGLWKQGNMLRGSIQHSNGKEEDVNNEHQF